MKWPTFILIETTDSDRSLIKLSPFAIQKGIEFITSGPVNNVSSLRSGALLIQVKNKQQADAILKSTKFIDIPITASAHKRLNTSRGVIRCRSLQNCTNDTEIVDNLKDQDVTEARRIFVTRTNGTKAATNTIILTFNTPTPPSNITICYEIFEVEPYIPNPLRCARCQQYGHHHTRCNTSKPAICAICGQPGHTSTPLTPCKLPPSCLHCKGQHATYSKDCPTWLKEKVVVTLKTKLNISFPQARKRVDAGPWEHSSFAAALTSTNPLPTNNNNTPPGSITPAKPATSDKNTQCELFPLPPLQKWTKPAHQYQTAATQHPAIPSNPQQPYTRPGSPNSPRRPDHAPDDIETDNAVQALLHSQRANTTPRAQPSFASTNRYDTLNSMEQEYEENLQESDQYRLQPQDNTAGNSTQGPKTQTPPNTTNPHKHGGP